MDHYFDGLILQHPIPLKQRFRSYRQPCVSTTNPRICTKTQRRNLHSFKGKSYSAAHIGLAEFIVRQIITKLKTQILHLACNGIPLIVY
ncbi:hypothetical protein D3C78_905300 [compost metagenome]